MGYVIQQGGLFPHYTVAQNVAVVPGLLRWDKARTAARVDELLQLVGLPPEEYRSRYPSQLSGGQQQRVGIARAIAAGPGTLLMDEPFGALDAQTRGIMQRELRQIWQATGASVFFITHDIDEAIALGSRVGIMTAGPGGTLKDVITIELEGERSRTDPAYVGYYARIQDAIRHEVERATRQLVEAA
jgi:ABC-type proline/glycine betaine transport system ATPase subunit